MIPLSSLTERQRFWYQHLQQAFEQPISLTEYAHRHGLSVSALYSAKGILKAKGVWRMRWRQNRPASVRSRSSAALPVAVRSDCRGCYWNCHRRHRPRGSRP